MAAVKAGKVDMVTTLLQLGADAWLGDNRGKAIACSTAGVQRGGHRSCVLGCSPVAAKACSIIVGKAWLAQHDVSAGRHVPGGHQRLANSTAVRGAGRR
jgi:hypothetical protein